MANFTHLLTTRAARPDQGGAVTDLLVAGADRVISVSHGGVVTVRDARGGMAALDTEFLPTNPLQLGGPLGVKMARIDGQDMVLVHGRAEGIHGFTLGTDGQLSGRQLWDMPGQGSVALDAELVEIGGALRVYTAGRGLSGVEAWTLGANGQMQPVQSLGLSAVGAEAGQATGQGAGLGNDIFALHQVELYGRAHLLAASVGDGTLSTLRLEADGRMTLVAQTGLRDGLPISAPTQVETVTLDGETYVLVGAAGSNSVSVLRLAGTGRLVPVDQVIDDLESRFQGVSVLETVEVEGRAYVIAGGADDGLTLMELLPGGRLMLRDVLADDLDMALSNPEGLVAVARAGGIDLYVTGSEAGAVTQLRVDLGARGETRVAGDGGEVLTGGAGDDTLEGGAGNDRIEGGAGDDVLIDGGGQDDLRGGDGADIFVLRADGANDRILDFEMGVDRLDLSEMGRFYSVEALDIRALTGGIRLFFEGERLDVLTHDRTSLDFTALQIGDLRGLWHVDVTPETPAALELAGGAGADTILGGAGDDMIKGGIQDADFDATAAQVMRLYQATLDRAPDPGGLQDWVARLTEGGVSASEAAARFVASAEFQTRYGQTDAEGFVTLLYRNVLDRNPDPTGLATWTARLEDGELTRADVVLRFAESREFVANTRAEVLEVSREGLAAEWSDDVFRLYQATLGRTPDLGGLQDWSMRLANGRTYEDVSAGFINSAEFRARYGADTTTEQFVTLLYANVLDRSPDPVGFASWTGRLDAEGWSRADVVRGFAQSLEFRAKSEADLVDWMRGAGADDRLSSGGAGDDVLFGGLLSDTFVFTADETGRKEVAGLERWDLLDFTAFDFASAEVVQAQFQQVGDDLRLRSGDLDVVLIDTATADLQADMILV